jgi:hypothetical protein
LQTAFDQAESEDDGGDGERDPNSARHGGEHGQRKNQPQQTDDAFALLRERNDKNSKNVQRNTVGHRLEKWAASAVGMKAEAFVKNETRKDEGAGIHEEGNGNEHEVGERKDDEDFEVPTLGCAPEDQHSYVKQRKGNDVLAGNNAPELWVEGFPKRAKRGERHETEHGQAQSGKEWDLIAERHRAQRNKEDQNSEGDSVGVIGKKVRWPEQENGHRSHIKDGGKRQSQMKGAKQQTGNSPKRVVVTVPG